MRENKSGRHPRPYTEDEMREFRRMADDGMSKSRIATALGRSLGSIMGTCARLGIKTHGGPGGTPSHGENS